MVDEVRAVLGTGKTLKIGDETWVIADSGTPPVFIDFITEARPFNGIVYLSLAYSVIDGGNAPEAHICARLRMNLAVAQGLRDALARMIEEAFKPVDQSKAN